MKELLISKEIDWTKATKAYLGVDGKCCCGCSGTYYYPSNPYMKRIINDIKNDPTAKVVTEGKYTYIESVQDKQLMLVYFF